MASLDDTPTFNLKAVVQETGLKPDTLRAWERRYGLPQPARTSGGHRLYSQRDIDIIKWLIDRQDEGLSISRAVDLWNQLIEDGKEPFLEMADEEEVVGLAPLEVGDILAQLRTTWIEACLDFDEQRAEYTLAQAFAMYPPETASLEVLQKGLAEIGHLWYEGKATAQQEHFASALAIRRLETLLAVNPPPTRPGRILIGCPPEEEHIFSPLLVTLLLRRRGWDTLYLGANVPVDRLEMTINRSQPDLVILTAQTLHTAATMMSMAELLQEEEIVLGFGGLIFNRAPSLRQRIPGHFLGERLQEAPRVVEQLMTSPLVTAPERSTVSQKYRDALSHFWERQSLVESYIWAQANKIDISQAHLARANRNLAQGIIAALRLGDMNLLGYDMDWVQGLLHNYHFNVANETLDEYLRLYLAALRAHIGEQGQLIVAWLEELLSSSNGVATEESEATVSA